MKLRVILGLLSVLVLFSCGPSAPAGAPKKTVTEAVIKFISGEVQVKKTEKDSWAEADIGDKVPVDAQVKTGSKSSCDLQFGQLGSIRLGASTIIALASIDFTNEARQVETRLQQGDITAKVNKLLGNDRFEVRTPNVACGVRGTVFAVSQNSSGKTQVAVKEGKVALLPPSYKAENVQKINKDNPEASQTVQAVLASAAVVQAGQEIGLTTTDMKASDEVLTKVLTLAADSQAKPADKPKTEELVKEFQASTTVLEAVPLSSASTTHFEKAQNLSIDPLPEAKADTADNAVAVSQSVPESVGVDLQASEEDAAVLIDGKTVGSGRFAGLFPAGTTLKVRFEKIGFKTVEETLTVEAGKPVKKAVKLESDGTKLVAFKVTADPSDAEILVDSQGVGTGSADFSRPEKTPFVLSLKRQGFKDYQETVDPAKGPQTKIIKLTKVDPVRILTLGNGGNLYLTRAEGKPLVLAYDDKGGLTAFQAGSGNASVLWSAKAGNTSSGNGLPRVFGDSVYFASDKELSAFSLGSGKSVFTQPLDQGNSGAFGRRPLVVGTTVYLTSDGGIDMFDAGSGQKTGVIDLSGEGSDTTPVVYKGKLHLVGRAGTYLVVDPAAKTLVVHAPTSLKQPIAVAPVVAGSKVVVADRKGQVVCLNADDPSQTALWERKLDPAKNVPVFSDPVVIGQAVFILSKTTLYVLNLATGENLTNPVENAAGLPLETSGMAWLALSDGSLVALDAKGSVAVKLPSGKKITGAPLRMGAELYFPAKAGQVVALNTEMALTK